VSDTQSTSLYCQFSCTGKEELLQDSHLLALVDFQALCQPQQDPRCYNTGLPVLGSLSATNQSGNSTGISTGIVEAWFSRSPVSHGREGNCQWSCSDEHMFAGLWIPQINDSSAFCAAVKEAYRELLALLQAKGFQHIARAWNYLPEINQGEGDSEVYKQFCLGREQAFSESHLNTEQYPSACAIGHHADHSVIYLLASKSGCSHFENPRQMAAYEYPRQYGPKSPSFARASINQALLHLSGTASVVGHETIHPNDSLAQLGVTIENIRHLLSSIQEQQEVASLQMTHLKVYCRHPEQYQVLAPLLTEEMAKAGFNQQQIEVVFLHGDICRAELALEIDGLGVAA